MERRCRTRNDPPSVTWMLLAMYGPPSINGRASFWSLVESFAGPWMAIGDFNNLKSNSGKRDGKFLREGYTRSFRNFMNASGTIDLGFSGASEVYLVK